MAETFETLQHRTESDVATAKFFMALSASPIVFSTSSLSTIGSIDAIEVKLLATVALLCLIVPSAIFAFFYMEMSDLLTKLRIGKARGAAAGSEHTVEALDRSYDKRHAWFDKTLPVAAITLSVGYLAIFLILLLLIWR